MTGPQDPDEQPPPLPYGAPRPVHDPPDLLAQYSNPAFDPTSHFANPELFYTSSEGNPYPPSQALGWGQGPPSPAPRRALRQHGRSLLLALTALAVIAAIAIGLAIAR